jgi:hypothetical protein
MRLDMGQSLLLQKMHFSEQFGSDCSAFFSKVSISEQISYASLMKKDSPDSPSRPIG